MNLCKSARTYLDTEDDVWDKVKEQIERVFGKENLDENLQMVMECLKHCDYITVFSQNHAKSFDTTILEALLKCKF